MYHVTVDPSHEVKGADDAASANWYDLEKVLNEFEMAFDHKDILKTFIQRRKDGKV